MTDEEKNGPHAEECACGHGCCKEHHHSNESGHHHIHGHDDACGCAACHELDDIFSENEEDEKESQAEFRREVTFLAAAGIVFAAALVCEELFPEVLPGPLSAVVFAALYIIVGLPVLKTAFKALARGDIFNEFTLMAGATLAALAIGEMSESVGVMLFYRLGEAFQERASSNSRRSIKALLAQTPVTARVVEGDRTVEKHPKEIVKGDLIRVMPGELIPIDGHVVNGSAQVDMSAISGESLPVPAGPGSMVHGGTLSLDGLLTIEAAGPFEDSTIARMLEMVQNAVARRSPTERFITRFAKWYTPAVFFMAAAVMLLPPLLGYGLWRDWIYRGLVLLVISCPCALVISIPLGYFGGIGASSKNGILVKGASVLDAVGNVDTVVFDKTGTLTYGKFRLAAVLPAEGVSKEELLHTAALAESGSNHPVAKAVTAAAGAVTLPEDASVTQHPGKGMVFRCGYDTIVSGNAAILAEFGAEAPATELPGTVVHVMKNGKYLGALIAADELRPESSEAVAELRRRGIKGIYMLTGDREETAAAAAKELRLDGYRSGLLPGDKVDALKELCGGDTKKTIYVGDGVNDGP
ncbi:MAG: heavy metal translocating P-type ATPase, partial [Synergistes sp.]|nr:heavy metal translocating P-type ATPase [Synergistes sp.]